jgi:hypothetical protein
MNRLTIEQALVLTGFTNILLVPFRLFHEDLEKRLGRPVLTHEIPSLVEETQEAYREDFMKLVPIDPRAH